MRRIGEFLVWILVILYIMGLGASAYHQHEVLTRKNRSGCSYRYEYIFEPQEEYTEDSQEVIVEGYAVQP